MRIIGIDTGSRWNAYAAIDGEGSSWSYATSRTIDAGRDLGTLEGADWPAEAERVARELVAAVLELQAPGCVVAVECSATSRIFGAGGALTAKRIEIGRSIAIQVSRILRSCGLEVREVPRATWARKLVGGKGEKVKIAPALRLAIPTWPRPKECAPGEYPTDHDHDAGGVAYSITLPDPAPRVRAPTVAREPRPARDAAAVKFDAVARQREARHDPTSNAAAAIRAQVARRRERGRDEGATAAERRRDAVRRPCGCHRRYQSSRCTAIHVGATGAICPACRSSCDACTCRSVTT